MFESAEREIEFDRAAYDARLPALRTELLAAQRELATRPFNVIVLVNGVEGAGKGDVVNVLSEWLDARDLRTHAFGAPTEEERQRPRFWRYWMAMPPKGAIGVLLGSWYAAPILDSVLGDAKPGDLTAEIERIRRLEKMLADDGTLFVKIWLHVSKQQQRRRIRKLGKSRDTRWRVTTRQKKLSRYYDQFVPVCEEVVRETSTGHAPWLVVSGTNSRQRDMVVAEHLLARLRERLDEESEPKRLAPEPAIDDPSTVLDDLDLTLSASEEEYDARLGRLQGKIRRAALRCEKRARSAIVVFEGSDAAGKGGAIRRTLQPLEARQYRVIRVAAPTDEERAHHYLWRFWRHLPRDGRITIYDRSWYGRVLVERVEGFAAPREWRRAYEEINEFEAQLVDHGVAVVKLWLQISPEEQLARFEERKRTPWKRHKITDEDWRNREKAPQYEAAAAEMVARTSTTHAPWTLVPAECKRYARLRVLETIHRALRELGDR